MAKIDAFFKLMFEQGASDLHLVSGQQPIIRLHGDMERVKYKVLEDGELKAMLYEIAPELKIKQYEETGDVVKAMRTLTPTHIVFNGAVGALTGDNALTAAVGERAPATVRCDEQR